MQPAKNKVETIRALYVSHRIDIPNDARPYLTNVSIKKDDVAAVRVLLEEVHFIHFDGLPTVATYPVDLVGVKVLSMDEEAFTQA